jgi:hypothetical protein
MRPGWIALAALALAGCGLYTGPGGGPGPGDDGPDAAGARADAGGRGADAGGRGADAGGRGADAGGRGADAGARPADARPDATSPRPRVLLIVGYAAPLDADLVRGALLADARIGAVDELVIRNSWSPPPDLDVLEAYDVVVFGWNDAYVLQETSRVEFGNTFADYVDAGGGVVTLAYAQGSSSLLGRLLTAGYLPLRPPAAAPYALDGHGEVDPSGADPLLAGVAPITAGEHPVSLVDPDAVLVASWTDGQPAAARKGAVVSLGLRLDPTDVALAGGWQRLLGNAVVAVAP